MAGKRRFVDAHVHLWDQSNGWYQFPEPDSPMGLGPVTFPQVFSLDDYRRLAAVVDTQKIVHVAATTGAEAAYAELCWLDDLATARGAPNAIISTLDGGESASAIAEHLARQAGRSSRFRGIRVLQGLDYKGEQARTIFEFLQQGGYVFDAVGHPNGGIAAAADALAAFPRLKVILEHTGWPLHIDDGDHFARWKAELAEFAQLKNSFCKLSGLGMTCHRLDEATFRTHWDYCLDLFTPERCMFGSNFPVERSYGSFEDLVHIFENTVSHLRPEQQDAVFAGVAEHVYRI